MEKQMAESSNPGVTREETDEGKVNHSKTKQNEMDSRKDWACKFEEEFEILKTRVKEMEEESIKWKLESQADIETSAAACGNAAGTNSGIETASSFMPSIEERMDADGRSVYVGNVDYSATAEELELHFLSCGLVNRVTILCNKYDGHPKGFAFIEFTEIESVPEALSQDGSLFKDRELKVLQKRTNQPGLSSSDRVPRGRRGGRPFFGNRVGHFRGNPYY